MPQGQPNPDHRQQETERLTDDFALKARSYVDPNLAGAVNEARRLIDDLDLRILRQERRVEKIILDRLGPREEMETVLAEMTKSRELMQADLDRLEGRRLDATLRRT